MSAAQTVVVPLDDVRNVAHAALVGAGSDRENALAVANVITLAERDGCASHGVFRLPGYLASLRSGKVVGSARPTVVRLAPGVGRIDGQRGFAPLAMAHAQPGAIVRGSAAQEAPVQAAMFRDGISLDEAVSRAERQYRARVVRTEVQDEDGRTVYVLKLLSENGRVFTVRIDAATGRMR